MPSFDRIDTMVWPGQLDVPEERTPQEVDFTSPRAARNFLLSGTAVSDVGLPYIGAVVKLFRRVDDAKIAETISDALGIWSFALADNTYNYYVVAFDASGSPMGVTTNTLVAV